MESYELIFVLCNVGAVVILLLLAAGLLRKTGKRGGDRETQETLDSLRGEVERLRGELRSEQELLRGAVSHSVNDSVGSLGMVIAQNMKNTGEYQRQQLEDMSKSLNLQLRGLQEDNNKRLDSMREIVDEKLQKTLNDRMTESFRLVNDRLEQVYKGLGEMQTLAQGVGDLKKVMSNVKTRGILGEIQLGAILEEILSPGQYEKNAVTRKGSGKFVEYAVKLPSEEGNFVYLPIDSKFPGESYGALCDAYETGSAEQIQERRRNLLNTIKAEAKEIRDKYIDPPNTTEFAVMFLPFEGLYAEVVNQGYVEILQREYQVNIAGPSTMAALLNSLQMGFRTFAIQKRSGEVWQVLGAVKTEFDKFADALASTQNRLNQANDELEKLVGTRTRQMQRKLKNVTVLEDSQAAELLEIGKEE